MHSADILQDDAHIQQDAMTWRLKKKNCQAHDTQTLAFVHNFPTCSKTSQACNLRSKSVYSPGCAVAASPDSCHGEPSSDAYLPPPDFTMARSQWWSTTLSSALKTSLRRPRSRAKNPPQLGNRKTSLSSPYKRTTRRDVTKCFKTSSAPSSAPPSKYSRLMHRNEDVKYCPNSSFPPLLLPPPPPPPSLPSSAPARARAAGGWSTAAEICRIVDSVVTFATNSQKSAL